MKRAAHWEASYLVLITKYYYSDQIKENEVGGACGTHGGEEKYIQDYSGRARIKKTT
jgi:hypothetical protein